MQNIAILLFIAIVRVQAEGAASCPCLATAVTQTAATGKPDFVTGVQYGYGCAAHDLPATYTQPATPTEPNTCIAAAADPDTTGVGLADDWCTHQWCIVDKDNCDFKTREVTFSEQTGDYFSYETCNQGADPAFAGNGWVGRVSCSECDLALDYAKKAESFCTCCPGKEYLDHEPNGCKSASGAADCTKIEAPADQCFKEIEEMSLDSDCTNEQKSEAFGMAALTCTIPFGNFTDGLAAEALANADKLYLEANAQAKQARETLENQVGKTSEDMHGKADEAKAAADQAAADAQASADQAAADAQAAADDAQAAADAAAADAENAANDVASAVGDLSAAGLPSFGYLTILLAAFLLTIQMI